ncbi:MAG: RDD family protein [Gemmatimonadaceae bacterium]|nr:RDD family protein [Acetobacteraceae bacterium]
MTRFGDDRLTDGVLMRRVWAWLIDALLIAVIVGVLFVVLLGFGLLTLGLGLPLLGLLPIVPITYHILFMAWGSGATPGQSAMDLVVRRDDDMGRPTLLQAVVFTVGLWLTLGAGVIWLAAALFTTGKRALHDLASGLVVVRAAALLTPPPGFGNMGRGPPIA